MAELAVYVPAIEIDATTHEIFHIPMGCTSIAPGSAIVGQPAGDWIEIYFEANLYNACNMTEYEDMLLHAADRMLTNYPTMARRLVKPEDLVHVGYYNTELRQVYINDDHANALLEGWKAKHWSKTGEANWDEVLRYRWGVKQ